MTEDVLFEPTWSASGIKTIASCGKQWWFRYRTETPSVQTPYLAFGKAVHRVIELIHRNNNFTDEFWQDTWIDVWLENSLDVDFTGYYKGKFTNSGSKMLQDYVKQNKNASVLELESPFETTLGRFKVRGVIDQVRRMSDGRLLVVDFKTSAYPLDPLILRADPQFSMYWHRTRQKYPGENPLMALYHLASGKVLYTERNDNDVLQVEAMIQEGQRKVDLQMFQRNIGINCRYCPFVQECLTSYVETNPGSPSLL